MVYNPTLWVNKETPVDANNMNKAEQGIVQQSVDVNILSEYVNEMDSRVTDDLGVLSDFVADLDGRMDNLNSLDVEYATNSDPTITTVKDALDKLLYSPLSISLSSDTLNIIEKGRIINTIKFNWSYNKTIAAQSFENIILDTNIREYIYSTPMSDDKLFTLAAKDDRANFSKSMQFNFMNGLYWGISSSDIYDNDFIQSLSKELKNTRNKTFTVNCGEGQYIYYCFPSRLGTPTFTVGGFSGGFFKVKAIKFENSYGYVEDYDIWKSSNDNLGNTTVVVN